jgi:nucleotide-binding universal stress UspA family protein
MRILVPVLDSVNALPAARYIVREFMGRERPEVHVLYVGSRLALALRPRLAEKSVAATRELLQWHGIRHSVELLAGNRAKAIVSVAVDTSPDLIVLGTARYRSATRMSEDAVIHQLLELAPAPLVVVAGKDVSPLERYGIAAGLGATLGLLFFA